MSYPETEYIALYKRLIEEKFHFENESGSVRQRDLQLLSDIIEEKSGIQLSVSTLKRIWKKDYNQTPHPSTLQALVSALGYKDWREFKLQAPIAESPPAKPEKKQGPFLRRWVALVFVIAVLTIFWLIAFRPAKSARTKPIIRGPVVLTGNKTVSLGVPNTVVFHYDLHNVEADSFFFQQSWNELSKVKIDPSGSYYSNIYYYPGFHKARLIANDSVIKTCRVHITTDGWLPLVRYSLDNVLPSYINVHPNNGALHVSRNDLIASNINADRDFILSYFNVRDFENTLSDNFSLDTRIKCDSNARLPCAGFELRIICEENIFFVRLMGKGCERNVAIKIGEVYEEGASNDLSSLGCNLYDWRQLQIHIERKKATIYLDDRPVHTIQFKNDFGKVMGLVYNFEGTGAIDYVKLRNGENKLIYGDDFQ